MARSWITFSSSKLKTNLPPINNALEKVLNLSGVYFNWKENGSRDLGMIAEEVAEIIPEVVAYKEKGK